MESKGPQSWVLIGTVAGIDRTSKSRSRKGCFKMHNFNDLIDTGERKVIPHHIGSLFPSLIPVTSSHIALGFSVDVQYPLALGALSQINKLEQSKMR